MKKYTVSVYLNDIRGYDISKKKGIAINYDRVFLSRYKNDYIRVIEFRYDSSGYKKFD